MNTIYINATAYSVIRLLGKGKGGYSYLVTDGSAHYTLKQLHHEPCDYYTFADKLASELADYEKLRDLGIPMPQLLAVDRENERLLKTYIPGPTAMELAQQGQLRPEHIDMVRAMCEKLYPAGLNIDYYPTNFILHENTLWYIDYECNPYDPKWNFENWGAQYWK